MKLNWLRPRLGSILRGSTRMTSDSRISRSMVHKREASQEQPAPLRKSTNTFAHHQIPLQCDTYDAEDYSSDGPVFLFFHSGGLVCGHRSSVPPWLAQVCHRSKWPLVSASYRLLPSNTGEDMLEDVRAAVNFAIRLGLDGGVQRKLIIGGASAGGFLATLAARHVKPTPVALLLICPIPTFAHPFFRSSVLLDPIRISAFDVERLRAKGPTVGSRSWRPCFDPVLLLPDGRRNAAAVDTQQSPWQTGLTWEDSVRMELYNYLLYQNCLPDYVKAVDPGEEKNVSQWHAADLREWPRTILIQAGADVLVDGDVITHASKWLGKRATIHVATGQSHLFEAGSFLEDDDAYMPTVHSAVTELLEVVAGR